MTGSRLTTLDAIRGVAALYVVVGHFHQLFAPLPLPHFWLAVDIFFLMSGFVLGRTYEPRLLAGMTRTQFMVNRYIRLYPLYFAAMVAGVVSGAITLALHKGAFGPGQFLIATVTGLLVLPSPTWAAAKDIIPLNFPGWSLCFELLISLVLVLIYKRLRTWLLVLIIAVNAVILVSGSADQQFGGESWGTVGWGFPRIGFSFFLGYLLQRYHPGVRKVSNLAWLVVGFVALLFWVDAHNRLVDTLTAFVISPLVIWVAAYVQPRDDRVFEFLGAISYPAYVLHMPLVSFIWRAFLIVHRPPETYAPWIGFASLALVILAAAILDRAFDRPVRRWLTKRFVAPSPAAQLALKKDTPL